MSAPRLGLAADPGRLHRDDPPDGHPDPRRLPYRLRGGDGGPRRHTCRPVRLQLGAAIIEGYATRHHDIDGIIPLSWSNQPQLSAVFQSLVFDVLVPQLAAGKDYVEFFLDGADGYSEFCERFLFYAPGMRDDALEQLCGPVYYAETAFPTPSGEAALPALQTNTVATIGNVGPTPALLVFSDRDAAFPGPCITGRIPTS